MTIGNMSLPPLVSTASCVIFPIQGNLATSRPQSVLSFFYGYKQGVPQDQTTPCNYILKFFLEYKLVYTETFTLSQNFNT